MCIRDSLHSSPSWPGQPTVFTNTTLVTGAASYVWSYGDGVTSTIESPSHTHTFAAPGVYTVVLTATSLVVDDVVSDTVTVSSPPAGVTVCPAGPPVCGYPTIQEGVDAATEGDVIKVATGVYTDVNGRPAPTGYGFPPPGGVVTQVVYITKTVTIRGGYTAPDFADPPDPDANPTMLEAEGRGGVILIAGSISPVIEGLQITGGDAAAWLLRWRRLCGPCTGSRVSPCCKAHGGQQGMAGAGKGGRVMRATRRAFLRLSAAAMVGSVLAACTGKRGGVAPPEVPTVMPTDALGTALSVLPVEQGLALLRQAKPHACALILRQENDTVREYQSAGFESYLERE